VNLVKKDTKGTILALLTALISGVAIFANKVFVVGIDPTVFTSVRALFIGIAFFIIIAYTADFKTDSIRRLFENARWKYLLPIAVIGGAAAFLLFFSGLQLTTGGRAAFIHKTLPIYVALFAYWFLKEKIPMKQTYALIIMLLGTVLIFGAAISPGELWANPTLGDFLILGATVLWAVENTIARKAMIEGDTNWLVSFSRMFIGALILFGAAGVMGKLGLLMSLTSQQVVNIGISTAILFGFVFCWYYSLRFINVSKAATFLLLAPVVSLALGAAFLGEPVPAVQMIGSALILVGAYLVVKVRSRLSTGV
jgi:drug/metabolite transporter (DMT)-like permease